MATSVTLEVAAVGNYDAWTLAAGADKVSAVQLPTDAGTTRIATAANGDRESYTIDPIPTAAVIVQVDISFEWAGGGGVTNRIKPFFRLGGTDLDYTEYVKVSDTSFQQFTESDVARPGGGSWTPADFASGSGLEVGVLQNNTVASASKVSTLWVVVQYNPPAGGYFFGCVAAPLVIPTLSEILKFG